MRKSAFKVAITFLSLSAIENAEAISSQAAREQARRLGIRISSVPPTSDQWSAMASYLEVGRADLAALIAMENPRFYTSTISNMFGSYSSVADVIDQPLNDFTALIVGLIKNNQSFDEVLYGDRLYVAKDEIVDFDPSTQTGLQILLQKSGVNRGDSPAAGKVRPLMDRDGTTQFGLYRDNLHYTDLQSRFSDWPNQLKEVQQTAAYSITSNTVNNIRSGAIPSEDIMGAWTTRQAMLEYISAGTNRRSARFAFRNFLCSDIADLHDISASQERIRQDIDRAPGGNPLSFTGTCAGCHAGLDGFTGALSYLNFRDNRIEYDNAWTTDRAGGNGACFNTDGTIKSPEQIANIGRCKIYRQYNNFLAGHQVRDNSFKNYWTKGINSRLGWRLTAEVSSLSEGRGANQMGRLLAATEAFSECMTKRVFERVCNRSPNSSEMTALRADLIPKFESGSSEYSDYGAVGPYNMRHLFARVSTYCFGSGE